MRIATTGSLAALFVARVCLGGVLTLSSVILPACNRSPAASDPVTADPPVLIREAGGRELLQLRENQIPGLTFTTVRRVDLPRALETTGQVKLDDRRVATIISRVAGRVEDTYASQWDTVKRGQVIVQLYSPDYMTAAAEYLQAIATSHVSTGPDASEQSKLATQIVAAARRKLELLGIEDADIDRIDTAAPTFVMRAPISGAAVEKQVVKGSQVNPGDVLFGLGVMDEVWITADIYESDLARVHEGQDLEAEPLAFPDRTFKGVVERTSPMIDPATHTAQIRCQVRNPSLELRPQMLMRVRIITSPGSAIIVPQGALVFETDSYYAFVEVEPDRIERRRVSLAAWNESGNARVLDGLVPGERAVQREAIQVNALWTLAHGQSS
jgi:Cu(I)/Ag(I) efflux system membrane fusion protein